MIWFPLNDATPLAFIQRIIGTLLERGLEQGCNLNNNATKKPQYMIAELFRFSAGVH